MYKTLNTLINEVYKKVREGIEIFYSNLSPIFANIKMIKIVSFISNRLVSEST